MSSVQLIVGLGNPGDKYDQTRHNAGFWFVDEVARQYGAVFRPETKFLGEAARIQSNGMDFWLLKPATFMNRSGQSIQALAKFYKIPVESILVVHDELDLEPGVAKLKVGGGHGGHNGLKSIDGAIGKEYIRVRMGIGRPKYGTVVDFVLGKFSNAENAVMDAWIEKACDAIEALETSKWDDVSARFSQKKIALKVDGV